jgi:N-acetyl sugar amidotransferase
LKESATDRAWQECTKCLYRSTHPFGLQFDADGVCTGCLTHREKLELNWDARFSDLEALVKTADRRRHNAFYDCVVPIRGTPEYFFVVDVVKNRLGLNPLVVSYNSQFNSEVGIMNIDRLREAFDVDVLIYSSNSTIYKKLIRESLVRFSNMRWPYLAGESVFPVQVAVERDIPLVIWPTHQATEQVGMHSYRETPEMSRRNRAEFDLMGTEAEELVSSETLLTPSDVWDLRYPSDQALERGGVRGLYLSNYLPWDSKSYSEAMIRQFGALGSKNLRTFDTYDRIDDMTYMGIHDVLKFFRHGYSRVTDNLCREVRFQRISREDARVLEAYYQSFYPEEEVCMFLDWLGMERSAFGWYAERMPLFGKLPCKPVLNDSQKNFVSGFVANGPDVMQSHQFTVYGKGLQLEESLAVAQHTPASPARRNTRAGNNVA